MIARMMADAAERFAHPRSSEVLSEFLGANFDNVTGLNLTTEQLMSGSAVFLAIRILSEDIAMLPLNLMHREDRITEKAVDHPIYPLLKYAPNPIHSSMDLRERMIANMCVWGKCAAYLVRDNGGRVREIWPLKARFLEHVANLGKDPRRPLYKYTPPTRDDDPAPAQLKKEDLWIVNWHQQNEHFGKTPVKQNRSVLERIRAADLFSARFYANGAKPSGIITFPNKIPKEQKEKFREGMQNSFATLGRAGRVMVLDGGSTYQAVGFNAEEAQALQTMEFHVQEVSRMFRIPPPLLMDLSRSTFSNTEQQMIAYVRHTILQWCRRFEQRISHDLLTEDERARGYFAAHNVAALERGDTETRFKAYAIAVQNGIYTRNEIRELEDKNPIEGADDLLVPANLGGGGSRPGGRRASDTEERSLLDESRLYLAAEPKGFDPSARLNIRDAFRPVIFDSALRLTKREVRDIRKGVDKHLVRATKDARDMFTFLDDFYGTFPAAVLDVLGPGIRSLNDAIIRETINEVGEGVADLEAFKEAYLRALADRISGQHKNQLLKLLEEEGDLSAETIIQRLDEWAEKNPEKIEKAETVRAAESIFLETLIALNITRKRWNIAGDSTCPICKTLSNAVVGVEAEFVREGTRIDGGRGENDYVVTPHKIIHPPLHGGCDCYLTAEQG